MVIIKRRKKWSLGRVTIKVVKLLEIVFQHLDGPYESYHKNGNLSYEGNFKDDRYDGINYWYYENGQKQVIRISKMENKTALKKFLGKWKVSREILETERKMASNLLS